MDSWFKIQMTEVILWQNTNINHAIFTMGEDRLRESDTGCTTCNKSCIFGNLGKSKTVCSVEISVYSSVDPSSKRTYYVRLMCQSHGFLVLISKLLNPP